VVDASASNARAILFGAAYDGPKREHQQASQASVIVNSNGCATDDYSPDPLGLNEFACLEPCQLSSAKFSLTFLNDAASLF
jgi:hypothetical protein